MPRAGMIAAIVLIGVTAACAAMGAESQRVRLLGQRAALVEAEWRATLEVRPAPRAAPRVVARLRRQTVSLRVRRSAAGRYALRARFPRRGRWRLEARVGAARHALGSVVVSRAQVRLASVLGIALHPDGSLLIADGDAGRVVRADLRTRSLATFASRGLRAPTGIDVARDGTVYVADRHVPGVFRIRNGTISRFADYPEPLDVAVDSQGAVFVTGRANTIVRVHPVTHTATRYAGTGEEGSSGNGGPALAARLAAPHGIAVDPEDNVVVAELMGVRRIDRATKLIDAIAGRGTRRSLCGERGPAREVCLTALRVAFATDGAFYVADPENSRLWRVVDGEARAFNLGFPPFDVIVESARSVLVADNQRRRVLRFDPATGAVTNVLR